MADAATVPQICCSFSSCCCSSVDKFSFKSLAYAGTLSRSSFRVIGCSHVGNGDPGPGVVRYDRGPGSAYVGTSKIYTTSVASPFFQLQGQSSSVCNASSTRR